MEEKLLEETRAACDEFRKAVEDLVDGGAGVGAVIASLNQTLLGPLREKYPYYTLWIDRFLSETIKGRPLDRDDPLYTPISNGRAFVAIDDKATRDQMLKVMLLKGSREQVFAAAKEIKMVYMDLPETDENFALLQEVIKNLADILG